MEPWRRTLLSFLLISGTYVWAKSGEMIDTTVNHVTNNCCDPEKYRQLQDRLDILETSVRNIVSAIASQKKGPFAPINAILERDPALNAVLSPQNNAGARISKESTVLLGKITSRVQGEKYEAVLFLLCVLYNESFLFITVR